jgi:hypothetical protein
VFYAFLIGRIPRQLRSAFNILAAVAFFAGAAGMGAAMSVSLTPGQLSPAPLGTSVTWTAEVSGAGEGTLWYRFRARNPEGDGRIIRDYSPINSLVWTTIEQEGIYEVEVSVRNLDTGDAATEAAIFEMSPCASGGQPVITQTAHPLVFLYSAPPCQPGHKMSVQFQSLAGDSVTTPSKSCLEGKTMNFYLAGLRPATQYSARHTVETGAEPQPGPELSFAVPEFSMNRPALELLQAPLMPNVAGVILRSPLNALPTATDLYGNLLWFYQNNLTYLTRPEPGGFFFGIIDNHEAGPSGQIVRKFDVAGITVSETNAARVNEQLVAMGHRPITAFHHEATALPDGKTLVLAMVEQILTDVQGPGDVNVLADAIVVLDSNLEVVWFWDAFDHLDPSRKAIFDWKCEPPTPGCSPFYLTQEANDWTHGNSVQPTPDANLLFSIRHQDWVVKIDYRNGEGSGDIIWRLGKDGDFVYDSTDPHPWFSHQHDARFIDESTIILFDNGNVRSSFDESVHSRGQVIRVDEQNRVATLLLNADLGVYSPALSSAGRLPNGNYYFGAGFLGGGSSMALEVDPKGQIVYSLKNATLEYRSFRMRDLYTPF